MVIVDVNFNVLIARQAGEFSDTTPLPGIYQDEPLYVIEIDLFGLGKVEQIGYGVDEGIAEVFFL